ncbi:CsbD family protein [Lacticaseibacillus parakribbianus]|uniref:CsbD family protein n=1 Tax=Lacticaseibacillus parakribbianus TaxID=2970927 RepID=UPI0021CB804A|nr:CsbD family protein [Lacticaseibacillus parakribbianus]
MSLDDKLDSVKDQVTGKAKEVEGKVTGDKLRESQGKAESLGGKLKGKVADAKDKLEDAGEAAKDKVEDAADAVKDKLKNLRD